MLPVHVLRVHVDAGVARGLDGGGQRRERRAHGDLHAAGDVLGQRRQELARLAGGLVHLPVAGDERAPHRGSGAGERSSAATPGRSRPSTSSRAAPPPVETCVMRSATPARFTAATESPPPTTDVASEPATASATESVPAANGSI